MSVKRISFKVHHNIGHRSVLVPQDKWYIRCATFFICIEQVNPIGKLPPRILVIFIFIPCSPFLLRPLFHHIAGVSPEWVEINQTFVPVY